MFRQILLLTLGPEENGSKKTWGQGEKGTWGVKKEVRSTKLEKRELGYREIIVLMAERLNIWRNYKPVALSATE